jgi:RNA polymerase sigma factor (sigma-70 family)
MRLKGSVLESVPDISPSDQFSALWHAYYRPVYAYARRRTTAESAADVATATFAVLWRRIDDLPVDTLPWLYSVARRELANQRRGDARRGRVLNSLSTLLRAGGPGSAADAADIAVDGASARAALARLRPGDREVLMLVAWEGLDTDEAAVALSISPTAFAVRLHRARRRLDAALSATPQEERPS